MVQKRKLKTIMSNDLRCQKLQQNILKLNPKMHKKNDIPWTNGAYFRLATLDHHWNITGLKNIMT